MAAPAPPVPFDLGLLGPARGRRVVVAMSGGVDSSVVAGLCAEAGCEVVGVTLQLYDHGAATGRKGACCAGQDIHDARRVADHLGIAHYVLDLEARFRSAVIEAFAAAYAAGQTPLPCVLCNQTVKFTDLLATARDLGAAALVTGHYVRRAETPDGPALLRAAEPARDQSYFLHATTRAQLEFCRFPLGGLTKAETRAQAARLGLPVAAKPDSQDICFVPQGGYAATVRRLRPDAAAPGEIVHLDGRVLGRHAGVIHYTVGQHRGLGAAANDGGEAMFVVRLDAARCRVVVGPLAALGQAVVTVGGVNWLVAPPAAGESRAVTVKLRSREEPAPARLAWDAAAGLAGVALDRPAVAAPGQACVFYDGERVLGGGTIRLGADRAPSAVVREAAAALA